jgi:alpha-N-arabinofuranosidase
MLFGYNTTMRDALVASLTLDTFHRHADKVTMANVAQLVNCIHSLFVAYEDKFLATPNYHVFDMYKEHQNAQAVRAVFGAPGARKKAPGLTGSASLKGKTLILTCGHNHHDKPHAVEISVPGASISSAKVEVLAGDTLQAHNTFAQPDAVKPRPGTASVSGSVIRMDLPPASVVRVMAELA